uniref:Chemokine interleukin-8-like domain-containing protein n=1 Tax=Erpetoichthys calabaricus TaxID=27687 RepID=A0A8C4S865_ERPCA
MTLREATLLILAVFGGDFTSTWKCFVFLSGNDDGAMDCCLETKDKPVPRNVVLSYRVQKPENGCSIKAIVFQAENGMSLCAPDSSKWVKNLMDYLDKNKRYRKGKPKGKHQRSKPKRQTRWVYYILYQFTVSNHF